MAASHVKPAGHSLQSALSSVLTRPGKQGCNRNKMTLNFIQQQDFDDTFKKHIVVYLAVADRIFSSVEVERSCWTSMRCRYISRTTTENIY